MAKIVLQLDAVNSRRRPVLDVTYQVSVDGKTICTAVKAKAGPQKLEVDGGQVTQVTAAYEGWQAQTVDLSKGGSWTFEFPGGGVPNVLVVCALPKETAAMTCVLKNVDPNAVHSPPEDPNTYWLGEAEVADDGRRLRVLVATGGMGTVSAAITATHALRSFPLDIEHVLMVGIAGGCPNPSRPAEHVRLGDIVVCNEKGVIQYDFIKRTASGDQHRAHPQRPSKALLDVSHSLQIAQRMTKRASWEEIVEKAIESDPMFRRPDDSTDVLHEGDQPVRHPADPERMVGQPRVHHGAIGSANILLKDPTMRDRVRDAWDVRAIEMEGSGVLDATWSMDRHVMIVRGICDYCDAYKNDAWQEYAALVAAGYARALIQAIRPQAMP